MTWEPPPPPLEMLQAMGLVLLALAAGSLVRLVAVRRSTPDVASKRLASLRTWWILALLLVLAVSCGPPGVAMLLIAGSALGLREYARITGLSRSDRVGTIIVYSAIPLHYGFILAGEGDTAQVLLPIGLMVALACWKSTAGYGPYYIRSTTALFWGGLLLVYAPAHVLLLYSLPVSAHGSLGPAGSMLYLVVLTEMNDIAQALVGRRIGAHKLTPRVSPKKSWEGLIAGVVVTLLLAVSLAPFLTGFRVSGASGIVRIAIVGALLSISGFIGDINMSAIKRDCGVKDGSTLLPGQGGVIDRIDSLTFTAPVFYYSLLWLSE